MLQCVEGTSDTYEGSLTAIWVYLAFALRADGQVKLLRIHGALPDLDMLRSVEKALTNGGYLFEPAAPWSVREAMMQTPRDGSSTPRVVLRVEDIIYLARIRTQHL